MRVMGSLSQALKPCLINDADSKEGEQRMEFVLYRLLCIAAALLDLFVVMPADYLNRLPLGVTVAELIFCIVTLWLYRESSRGRYRVTALFFLFLAVLNGTWFQNEGSLGSVGYYFFAAFVYPLIFFRGKARWLLLGVAIANAVGLMAAEQYFPQWVTPYQSEADRVADLMVGLTVSALYCSLMLWAVLSGYDREQKRLKSLNEDLERNVAERTQMEKSLRQSQELLNAIIEGTSDAVYAKDSEGRYLIFNKAAALLTGKSALEALGHDDTAILAPDEAEKVMKRDREVLASGKVSTVEHSILFNRGTGERVVLQATKGPLHDDRGNIVGVFGISRDVTVTIRTAEELRMLNEELELRVAKRTARLEAAMREQESFSYSVSHDLRAPLRHINSYAAILNEEFGEVLTCEARGYLERIRGASRRMGTLIDDLLELSRIGRSELRKGPVNLSELARTISSKLQETEPERCVEFVIEPDLTVHGDEVLLGQMLENLIDNAWKYSRPRESARIELAREQAGGSEVFSVRDNGVGFDMAYRDKLFGAFQRLHGVEFEGTGIGLATVKRIVERHNGSVWAEGTVDEGAAVYFTLP